jgi:hypothetical protein
VIRTTLVALLALAFLRPLAAQTADSAIARKGGRKAWLLGAVTSLAAHEAGHVVASLAMGRHPSLRMDKGRPTIFSGINITGEPHKQLVFSSAGLVVQAILDELMLDLPHGDSPFKRGVIASGIGTVLFYITLGRNGAVSDIALIARTSGLSKGQVSLIAGGVAAMHGARFGFDDRYGRLFFAPTGDGRMKLGVKFTH